MPHLQSGPTHALPLASFAISLQLRPAHPRATLANSPPHLRMPVRGDATSPRGPRVIYEKSQEQRCDEVELPEWRPRKPKYAKVATTPSAGRAAGGFAIADDGSDSD